MLINQGLGEKLNCSTLIKIVLAAITKIQIHLHVGAFLRKDNVVWVALTGSSWGLLGNAIAPRSASSAAFSWHRLQGGVGGVKNQPPEASFPHQRG